MASHDYRDGRTAEENANPASSIDKTEALKVRTDILWGLFEEHRGHARHTETLRSTVNSMLIVASAALVTLATYDKKVNWWDLPAALLLVGFGFLGFLFTLYHTEKIVKHKTLASEFEKELDTSVFREQLTETPSIEDIQNRTYKGFAALSEGEDANKLVALVIETAENMKLRTSFLLWSLLPAFIAAIGL